LQSLGCNATESEQPSRKKTLSTQTYCPHIETHKHTHTYSCSAFRNEDRGWDVELQEDGTIITNTVTARMRQSNLQ